MKTEFVRVGTSKDENDAIFCHAAEIIRSGGLVAFPTETVYGLGANAFDSAAIKKIYAAKGRPSDNPLIAHIASEKGLNKCVSFLPDSAMRLISAFWPGALTLIFKKNPDIPAEMTGGRDTIAVRWPKNWVARRLIETLDIPIAAPSANVSGGPSPTDASHVWRDLNGKVDMIIDGGPCDCGIESTIVDVTDKELKILRPGLITAGMIESTLSMCIKIKTDIMRGEAALAPGMKYAHYAPRAEVTVVDGDASETVEYINNMCAASGLPREMIGIFAADETVGLYTHGLAAAAGSRSNPESVARTLYAALRRFDELGVKFIYSEAFYETELGLSIMNRLEKAAQYNIVRLRKREGMSITHAPKGSGQAHID